MSKPGFLALAFVFCFVTFLCSAPALAQQVSPVVVLREMGLPPVDCPSFPQPQLEKALPGARFVSADQLASALAESATRLLVLPYGSAFPEENWSAIGEFLEHGGDLLVLGGRPFTRAAYRDDSGWHLRDYSVRFIRQLSMDQFQTTPGSQGMQFQDNPDVTIALPRFPWQRAFSPIIRLSAVDLYNRGGSAGSIDARLDALAWGVKDGRKMSAPAIEIDHLRNGFDGGRWIFLASELDSKYAASNEAVTLIRALAERARHGSEEFTARPTLPLYLPGEPVEVQVLWHPAETPSGPLRIRIAEFPESQPSERQAQTADLSAPQTMLFPAPKERGFHIIEAELLEGGKTRNVYRSGFWIRDPDFLRTGPHLTVNRDFFEIDGHAIAVVGTTYMSSEVQRLYFDHPNVYVWDRDMAQIQAAGLNMLRTAFRSTCGRRARMAIPSSWPPGTSGLRNAAPTAPRSRPGGTCRPIPSQEPFPCRENSNSAREECMKATTRFACMTISCSHRKRFWIGCARCGKRSARPARSSSSPWDRMKAA